MSTMSAQNPNNEYRPAEAAVEDTAPRRGTSPLLLMLLAFAVTVAAVMWWSQNRQASRVAPVVTTPAPAVEADRPAQPTAAERTAANRERAQRTAPVIANRDPRPLSSNADPKYPASMLRAGVGGTVVVMAEVDAKGMPTEVRVVERSGERELDRAALTAVRQWRFEPAVRNGKATASAVRVPVDFTPI